MARFKVTLFACEACGLQREAHGRQGDSQRLPEGWQRDEHLRCAACVAEGRQPPALTVRWMPGFAPKPPPTPKPPRTPVAVIRQRVRDHLVVHPEQADPWVAEQLGCDTKTVHRWRLILEADNTIPRVPVLVRRNGASQRRRL